MVSRIFYATLKTSCLFILLQTGQILEVLAVEFPEEFPEGNPVRTGGAATRDGRNILREEELYESSPIESNSHEEKSEQYPLEGLPVENFPALDSDILRDWEHQTESNSEETNLQESAESTSNQQGSPVAPPPATQPSEEENRPLLIPFPQGEGTTLREEEDMLRPREAEVNTLQEDDESTPSSPTPEQVSEDEGEGTILHDSQPAR